MSSRSATRNDSPCSQDRTPMCLPIGADWVGPRRGVRSRSSGRYRSEAESGAHLTADLQHQAALTHLESGAQELPDSAGTQLVLSQYLVDTQ